DRDESPEGRPLSFDEKARGEPLATTPSTPARAALPAGSSSEGEEEEVRVMLQNPESSRKRKRGARTEVIPSPGVQNLPPSRKPGGRDEAKQPQVPLQPGGPKIRFHGFLHTYFK